DLRGTGRLADTRCPADHDDHWSLGSAQVALKQVAPCVLLAPLEPHETRDLTAHLFGRYAVGLARVLSPPYAFREVVREVGAEPDRHQRAREDPSGVRHLGAAALRHPDLERSVRLGFVTQTRLAAVPHLDHRSGPP